MNVRTYITLEITKEDRSYVMSVPFGAAFQEAHDVTQEFAAGIIEMAKQAEEQQKAQQTKTEVEPEIVGVN